eukprot:7628564-Prorocentrum_lima.AAC.1
MEQIRQLQAPRHVRRRALFRLCGARLPVAWKSLSRGFHLDGAMQRLWRDRPSFVLHLANGCPPARPLGASL